jgi:steroid delta-isomerase-like uncharacterized protein
VDAQELIETTTRTWNERDRAGYLTLYTDDCEISAPGFTGRGHEDLGAFYDVQMTALPDNRITVLRTAVGDDGALVIEESVVEGTHNGPLVGADGSELPATGRHLSASFTMVHELRDGKLAASRLYYDQLEFLAQLGVTAEAAPA